MYNRICFAIFGLLAMCLPGLAFAEPAEPTITMPDLPLDNMATLATTILGGLAFLWGVRKVIKLVNRS